MRAVKLCLAFTLCFSFFVISACKKKEEVPCVEKVWYQDADGDGYGNLDAQLLQCDKPDGYVANSDDCDDTEAGINPGAEDIPDNGIDENCNGLQNALWYEDSDGDGFGNELSTVLRDTQPTGYVENKDDCDDTNNKIYPGAPEVINNGIDENCDGFDDVTWYLDADGDGYGHPFKTKVAKEMPAGYTDNGQDCNDSDSEINPGASEKCDGKDNNCNNQTDEGFNFMSDPNNCGGCGIVCPTGNCVNGNCQ